MNFDVLIIGAKACGFTSALLLVAACAHPIATRHQLALDELLQFTSPTMCELSAPHRHLLDGMIAGDANAGFSPGFIHAPKGMRRLFGPIEVRRHDSYWTVEASVEGTLFGIPLVAIIHSLPEGGDAGDVTYVFDAPIATVESALRARGFPARAGQEVELGSPDLQVPVMALLVDPKSRGRTLLSCYYR